MRPSKPAAACRVAIATCAIALGAFSARVLAQPAVRVPVKSVTVHLYSGLGTHGRKISTSSETAQKLFDQGLAFLYGFNHDEAIRSFEEAAQLDPQCTMIWWGIALANGPHINNPGLDEAHAKAAWAALSKARDLADNATPTERALIHALTRRYAEPQASAPPPDRKPPGPKPPDRKPLDEAYADAMRAVWKLYPEDADVGALTAEALMDLRPWDQWTHAGEPQPGTDEVLRTLNAVLAKSPQHPLALHLLIHAVEASPHPEKADAAAERLRDLEPALGHMVHMPSHIDVRRGRWNEAAITNENAINADKRYRTMSPHQGFYRIYMAHNHHMLAYAAMMQGQSQKATQAVADLLAGIPEEFIQQFAPMIDGFFAMPYELHMRFGRWDAMLAEPPPRDVFPITKALWHYGRGVAFAARNQLDQAKSEERAFHTAAAAIPKEAVFGKNAAKDLVGIAEKMLAGEILYREGKVDAAIAALREAVRREDDLHYMEPPDWIQPVRHALGASLMDAKRYAEAEAVYRDDLARYPENGWSLYGLSRSLRMQGKEAEALPLSARFEKVWKHADVKLSSSCFCLEPKRPD